MSLFDFLKRKKEIQKTKEKSRSENDRGSSITSGQPEKKAGEVLVKKEEKIEKQKVSPVVRTTGLNKGKSFSYDIVKAPHISEKSTLLSEKNKYVFKVYERANKPEIKKSVEGIYGVDVLAVNIIKIPKKKRRIGRTEGFKKGHTKAIVTIKEGQKIEVF